jgi:lipoprotein-releasing system ATP-binding protein
MKTVLQTFNLNKYFYDPVEYQVLKDISLELKKKEFVSIMGKSGCGKSTLLYILSTMDTQYAGKLMIDGEEMGTKSKEDLAAIRNEKIGFVFQFHYLLPEFSVLKNVMLPALKLGEFSHKEIEEKAFEKLNILGVKDLAHKKAYKISGGEKQRVSIARALINEPKIIMGDEPTGNLDSKNADNVFNILRRLSTDLDMAMLIVTHDEDFAKKTDRIIEMEDGKIIN